MKIQDVKARWILDSRGNPTVEAEVWLEGGQMGRASVPSGASTGKHEAVELRDDSKQFGGQGVNKAIDNIRSLLRPSLLGLDASDQALIDAKMIEIDGSENKAKVGANAILAVSLATAKAAAKAKNIKLYEHINQLFGGGPMLLPRPMMNVINGGRHAPDGSDIQETMIIPLASNSIEDIVRIGSEIFHCLAKIMRANNQPILVGDEGGFAPSVKNYETVLDFLMQAIKDAGYAPGKDVAIALDVAISELFNDDKYNLKSLGKVFSGDELIQWYASLCQKYPIISIEDGLDEDDWRGWSKMTSVLGDNIQLVGDDLLVTNTARLREAIKLKAGNAILIKPNQIGTLSETLQAIKIAQQSGFKTIISHRSGETEDVTIAHIAVGANVGQIKTGSLSRTDRVAKYNELMRISEGDPSLKI